MTHFACQGYTFLGVHQPQYANVDSSAPSWNLVDLTLLLMTNYGVNFMLVSWSFPTEPAMPFSGILPCREYFDFGASWGDKRAQNACHIDAML